MSDEHVRELERRWAETGTPEDEGAYLLALTRAGEFSAEALELAACCGYRPAAFALDVAEPSLGHLQAWFETHEPSPLVRARFALATAHAVVQQAGGNARCVLTVLAFDAWVVCPCDEHAAALRERAGTSAGSWPSAQCTTLAVQFGLSEQHDPAAAATRFAEVAAAAAPILDPKQLWTAISAEVVPWLLQRGDPVSLRVGRRQDDANASGPS